MKNLLKVFRVICIAAVLTNCDSEDPAPISPNASEALSNLQSGVLRGTLKEVYTLNPEVSYQLTGAFIVGEGAVLNIPAGTRILAHNGGTDVYVAVLKGGQINVNGNATSPVVMTSENGHSGDWGGLTLCGKAITTAGIDAVAEVGGFLYGGSDNTDSSGIIRYLRMEGTGAQINSESQYNGVSFYAVGTGTIVDNLAVINGSDDGVEFFGGTVSVSNLYVENTDDDAIDWTEGWSGTINKAYILHTISGFSTAFEGDKDNGNPKFINITAISTVGGTALQFKKQSGGTITNLSLRGYEVDLDMKDLDSSGRLDHIIFEDGYTPVALATEEEMLSSGNYFYTLNTLQTPTVDIAVFDWVNE